MMTHKIRALSHCLFAALTLSACDDPALVGSPEPSNDQGPATTPAELGLGDDWTEVEPGLWTRIDPQGEPQFAGIGELGQLHALASLERAEDDLKRILAVEDREETRAQLAGLDALITELRSTEFTDATELELRCTPSSSAFVDAYPSACGVGAKASATYSHCANTGGVMTYAQTTCGYETKTHQCGYKYGKAVTCSSTASIVGAAPCNSYAYAEVSAPYIYVSIWDENFVRGTCSPAPPSSSVCDSCALGKSCHCGDNVCRSNNTVCP